MCSDLVHGAGKQARLSFEFFSFCSEWSSLLSPLWLLLLHELFKKAFQSVYIHEMSELQGKSGFGRWGGGINRVYNRREGRCWRGGT